MAFWHAYCVPILTWTRYGCFQLEIKTNTLTAIYRSYAWIAQTQLLTNMTKSSDWFFSDLKNETIILNFTIFSRTMPCAISNRITFKFMKFWAEFVNCYMVKLTSVIKLFEKFFIARGLIRNESRDIHVKTIRITIIINHNYKSSRIQVYDYIPKTTHCTRRTGKHIHKKLKTI